MATAVTGWTPDGLGVSHLLGLLKSSRSVSGSRHWEIQQQLQELNRRPEYNKYLAFILVHMQAEPADVRQLGGIILKNNVKDFYSHMSPDVQEYIKAQVLQALGDPSDVVRTTAGTIVTSIVTQGTIEHWPTLLQTLAQALDSQDLNLVEGAFDALCKVCEDSANKLDSDEIGRPLNFLIPKLLSFFASPVPTLRKYAVASVNQFVLLMPNALAVNMDAYLRGLFSLATDPTKEVRKRVCQAIVMLLEVRLDCLMPHILHVVEYMLHATQDVDEAVALEACEFWSALCETKVAKDVLRDVVPRLVPVLLKGMVYSEMDISLLDDEDENDMVPDRPEDIKPRFYHIKSQAGQHQPSANPASVHDSATNGDAAAGDEDDEEDEDGDDDDDEVSEWNLRKCSAAGLDILSGVFGDEVLPVLLPLIQARLADPKWEVKESAILAIGAIAEGCIAGMRPHLPQLIPFLISILQDPKPLVRSITCWTLSRYAKWMVAQNDHSRYLQPLMQELLKRVLDHNKRVQEAACSAFATLEEEAQLELVPYLGPILENLMYAFRRYQAKNLLILYDAVGTLANSVGSELNRPEYIAILMPPLIEKWNQLSDNDKNLFPLLECLTSIAQALGPAFQNFAEPVFQRCLKLIECALKSHAANSDEWDKEFIVCALDLLSGLAEGLREGIEALVSKANLMVLLFESCKDSAADVRQSAFALVGDLAKTCSHHFKPYLSDFIGVLTNNLNPEYISVCNNACWALGELAVKVGGGEMKPYVVSILPRLVALMTRPSLNKSLAENTAITLGRLGMVCPDGVAPRLAEFIQPWCSSLRSIRDDIEKEHAFKGLCSMIKLNPYGVTQGNSFAYLCDAILSWQEPNQELRTQFYEILHGFKLSLGPNNWTQYMSTFPPALRQSLADRYSLSSQ